MGRNDNRKSEKTQAPQSAAKPKMGRPVTTGRGELVGVRILPALLKALDTWIAEHQPGMTRPEAIRHIIAKFLREQGYLDKG